MNNYTEALKEQLNKKEKNWTWTEAVSLLNMNQADQLLLCALTAELPAKGNEMDCEKFYDICRQVLEETNISGYTLPHWIYEADRRVLVSPVLTGWLEGELPRLPEGVVLKLTKKEKTYGLDKILKDAGLIFAATEKEEHSGIFCIEGERGSGRTFCMEQVCAEKDMALLLIDGDVFKGAERAVNACILCAKLYGAFACVKLGKETREELLETLSDCFMFYGLIKDEERELKENPKAVVYRRKLTRPDRELKKRIAREIMGESMDGLPEAVQVAQLTGKQLPMGEYLRWLKNIRAEIEAETLSEEYIKMAPSSGSLNLLPATRTFQELKLPKAQYGQLQKISKMIASRETVMAAWGFGRKFTYGNGMSILFYGAPGTGKTMAAQVLANELGMPLYRVDLSQLISKYIGETQKNVGKIFDEAEKYDCILLFDEADAIFAKRGDVSDAQDRYSNAETAYLLQRIEQYAGVSILATNLLQNFDEAFRRRISYMVHFPMPDVNLRRELWETIFPKEAPVSAEVDAQMLAQAFDLSGASIKSAALHGALLAGTEDSEVGMRHILDGIRNEYEKQGKSLSSSQKELMDAYQ